MRPVSCACSNVSHRIGGGVGQDFIKFLHKHPESAGRLVVQDLPEVIEEAKQKLPRGIKA